MSFIYFHRQRSPVGLGGNVLVSFIYTQRQRVIRFKSEGHRWAWGKLCCCHSFIFNVNVSFISKVRVTGGFFAVCLSPAPVWLVAVLQVEFFIDPQPFQLLRKIVQWPAHMFQFLSAWGSNQGRCVCECSMHTSHPHGAMALQMLPLPHSCVCKRRLLRACTLCTWDAKTPFCMRKLHLLRVDCFWSESAKTPFCVPKRPYLHQASKKGGHANRLIYVRKNAIIASLTCGATRLCHMRPKYSFYIMPLHPWQFHHLALGNRKGRGERICNLQHVVHDIPRNIMGEDWHVRMWSGVTNLVDVYMDVPFVNGR